MRQPPHINRKFIDFSIVLCKERVKQSGLDFLPFLWYQ